MSRQIHDGLEIDGFELSVGQIIAALERSASDAKVRLSAAALERCTASRAQVTKWLGDDAPVVYGINTGLGNLKDVVLSPSEHVAWNSTIPYPHAAGLGDYIHPKITRTALLVRANVLARGYSGARPELIERLLAMFNAGIAPAVRELASVGLSDLAPLAHIAMVASGIPGARVISGGAVVAAPAALEAAGLPARFVYECKDTLSTMNGASMTQAAGVLVVHAAQLLLDRADAGAAEKQQRSQFTTQEVEFIAALRESFDAVRGTLDTECNVSCDNPLLFDTGEAFEAVMGCNCSNTQVGYDLDVLSGVLAERGALLVHKIARDVGSAGHLANSDLAGEIARDAASRLLRRLCESALPASVDSIPTKSGQEDHVEFSYGAARKAYTSAATFAELLALSEVIAADEPFASAYELSKLVQKRNAAVSEACQVIPFQLALDCEYLGT